MKRELAIALINEERERQIELGWDADHDARHGTHLFVALLTKQLSDLALSTTTGERLGRRTEENTLDYKTQLVQLAAVAVAALERYDR